MTEIASDKREQLKRAALDYHERPAPGKLAVAATKPLSNQRDLALAYSPGVAAPCEDGALPLHQQPEVQARRAAADAQNVHV
ncbi:MAG: hypothetical protein ACK4TH_11030, partial [Tepidimonas sp.]